MDLALEACLVHIDNIERLSTASKRQYKTQLKKLVNESGKNVPYILDNPLEIYEWIQTTYPDISQRKAIIQPIFCLYKYYDNLQQRNKKKYTEWRRYADEINKEAMSKQLSQKASEKMEKSWLDWKTIIEKRDELLKTEPCSPRHLLLSLYTYIPPLRGGDFACVRIYANVPKNKEIKDNTNYLVLNKRRCVLFLNNYKTSSVFGKYKRELPKTLKNIIEGSLHKRPREHLFMNVDGSVMAGSNSMTSYACKVLTELFGKATNLTMFRHAYLTSHEYLSKSLEERMSIAKDMLHSFTTAQMYLVKDKVETETS